MLLVTLSPLHRTLLLETLVAARELAEKKRRGDCCEVLRDVARSYVMQATIVCHNLNAKQGGKRTSLGRTSTKVAGRVYMYVYIYVRARVVGF